MNPIPSPASVDSRPIHHRVLSLDGGGAKGVYTLGFLSRLEKDLGKPIHEHFDLIYGTSTGAIIAALVSLGTPIEKIYDLYLQNIPGILTPWMARSRSRRLRETAALLFNGKDWADLKKPTGLVATNWDNKQPMVFKNYSTMAHGGVNAFIPGFGATLVEGICASCSAVPLFKPVIITVKNRGNVQVPVYDGGFCANNPALFALVDLTPLNMAAGNTVLFSVGVGHYPEPKEITLQRGLLKISHILRSVKILTGVLEVSSNTNGILQKLLMKEVRYIRADESFSAPDLGTDLLETNLPKLKRLFARGTESYEKQEKQIHLYL